MGPIEPMHSSLRQRCRQPYGFDSMECTNEQRAALEQVAIDTFTSMVNAGHTFQSALGAVYLSGIHHAIDTTKESGL